MLTHLQGKPFSTWTNAELKQSTIQSKYWTLELQDPVNTGKIYRIVKFLKWLLFRHFLCIYRNFLVNTGCVNFNVIKNCFDPVNTNLTVGNYARQFTQNLHLLLSMVNWANKVNLWQIRKIRIDVQSCSNLKPPEALTWGCAFVIKKSKHIINSRNFWHFEKSRINSDQICINLTYHIIYSKHYTLMPFTKKIYWKTTILTGEIIL